MTKASPLKLGDRVRIRAAYADSPPAAKGRIGTITRVEFCAPHELGITVQLDAPVFPGESPVWVMRPIELEKL